MQEGWHYHIEEEDAPIKIGGVVYNEMRGAHSSPDNLLIEFSKQSLFPDSPYRYESGGDPEEIIELSFEKFIDFHQNYYHPSNAWVFFYGDDDPEFRLKLLSDYFKDFTKKDISSDIPMQKPISSPKKIEKRAKVIGLGALKFFLLKFDPKKDMLYDPEESISFEGETGPYVQYAHARICSILKKHGKRVNRKASFQLFNDQEKALAKQLSEFPSVVSEASYKPSVLCHYLVKLSQEFNTYYVNNPILTQEPVMRDGKLVLILCIKQVLSNGLKLLGIKAPKRM